MNRLWLTDSRKSLDLESGERDSAGMIAQPYQLYVERKDPTRNMARYYAMAIEATLFGDVCLTRRWGRIGARGQARQHHFEREEDAVLLFLELLRRKRMRGYRPQREQALKAPESANPVGRSIRSTGFPDKAKASLRREARR